MKTSLLLLLVPLLEFRAHAQSRPTLPDVVSPLLRATLDTVAVTGTTRVLTLATTPGPTLTYYPLAPGIRQAVLYTPLAAGRVYDVQAIRVLVSAENNRSTTGQLLLNLVLPDLATGKPSAHALLPAPLVVSSQQVRRAKQGLLTLDVQAHHLSIPPGGLFVVVEGATSPPDEYLGDTLIARGEHESQRAVYAKLRQPAYPARLRVVNITDFICVRGIRTSGQPQSWDYSPRKASWVRRQAAYTHCPSCVIANAGLELVVREL